MDMMFEAYLTHEAGHLEPDDIPHTSEPVWVLGKKYNAIQGMIRNFFLLLSMTHDFKVKEWWALECSYCNVEMACGELNILVSIFIALWPCLNYYRSRGHKRWHSHTIMVYLSKRICYNWRFWLNNRQRMGLHAALRTNGSCPGSRITALGWVLLLMILSTGLKYCIQCASWILLTLEWYRPWLVVDARATESNVFVNSSHVWRQSSSNLFHPPNCSHGSIFWGKRSWSMVWSKYRRSGHQVSLSFLMQYFPVLYFQSFSTIK